jgi:hypothetical protein
VPERRRRKLQKDDLPPELWPKWDELEELSQHMHRAYHQLDRLRIWGWLLAGAGLGSALVNIALAVSRG